MIPLGLFAVPLPSQPTVTQVEAAHRLAPVLGKIEAEVYGIICARWHAGSTPREIAQETGQDLVTVRARCTSLHQSGRTIRGAIRRHGELVYWAAQAWKPEYGCTPSRRHGAR